MEANKAVALVRLNHQKNDPGDEPEEITQRPGKVTGQARARRPRLCRRGSRSRTWRGALRRNPSAARTAESRTRSEFGTTLCTKSHNRASFRSLSLRKEILLRYSLARLPAEEKQT